MGSDASGNIGAVQAPSGARWPKKGFLMMNIIEELEKEQADAIAATRAIPEFAPGDTRQGQRQGDRRHAHARPGL